MFRQMRRQERCLSNEKGSEILESGQYGVLSLIGNNGYPYGVPIHYIMKEDKIYFHSTRAKGLKTELLERNNHVSFTVIETNDGVKCKSVICFGTIHAVSEKKAVVLERFVEKFVPLLAWEQAKSGIPYAIENMQAYELTIEHKSAKWIDKPEGK